uniref:Uncharacterized protein n=1 Tax=Myoviridae sp. ctJfU3 TaxID=2826638 RepID=A0A8S5MNW9_9CAUD|nr:MAG TPA: hypothetical protein [Myoviridae sp. ctJfU3]
MQFSMAPIISLSSRPPPVEYSPRIVKIGLYLKRL